MGLIPHQPTVEELDWCNSPFPIPAFCLQPFAFSLFLKDALDNQFNILIFKLKFTIIINWLELIIYKYFDRLLHNYSLSTY